MKESSIGNVSHKTTRKSSGVIVQIDHSGQCPVEGLENIVPVIRATSLVDFNYWPSELT